MKKKISIVAALVFCAVLFGSCLDFFTTSLGGEWARDPGTITVTSSNVNALLKESRGDPKASKGILDKIAEELAKNPTDTALQAGAVTAANQAAGLGELVLGNIGTVLENIDSDETTGTTFNTLLTEIAKTAKENDIKGVSDKVTASLKESVTTTDDDKPVLTPDFIDTGISDSDLTLLALTLVLGEAEKANQDFDEYIGAWGESKTLNGTTGLTESEKLIAAIGNHLSMGDSEIGQALKGLLGE